jgi:Xaa-Pro aminopeptidase
MVVSNEPGYYEEGKFGIRIENLIFVKQIDEVNGKKLLGFENLTFVPIDTRLLDLSLLIQKEKDWLNAYHQEVLEKVGPHVEGEVLEWVEKAVKSI